MNKNCYDIPLTIESVTPALSYSMTNEATLGYLATAEDHYNKNAVVYTLVGNPGGRALKAFTNTAENKQQLSGGSGITLPADAHNVHVEVLPKY